MGTVRKLVCAAVAATVLAATPAEADAGCSGANAKPEQAPAGKLRKALACLINEERAKQGLAPLGTDKRLTRAATEHSRDMVELGFFDHDAPDGATMLSRIQAVGYLEDVRLWTIAENIACGSGRMGTPAAILRQWMESPGHRVNLLNPVLRDVGIGIAKGMPTGSGGATFTLDLGLAR